MNKSNYELHAEKEQPKKLATTSRLWDAVMWIKGYATFINEDYIEGMKMLIGGMYGLEADEVNRLVNGDEYWIV